MKIKKNLLHIGLFITVAISIVFSAIIWIDPVTFHRNTTQTTTTNEAGNGADSTIHYDIADIYSPTALSLTQDGKQMQLTSSKDNLISDIWTSLQKIKMQKITGKTAKDFNDYRNNLNGKNEIVLSYSNPISIGLFGKMTATKNNLKDYQTKKFKHIVLPLADHHTLYLMNDENYQIYQVKLANAIPKDVYKVVKAKDIQQTAIEYSEVNKDHVICSYPDGVTVSQYSYLINTENPSLFVTHLLGSGDSSAITTKEHDGTTIYTTANNQRLTINSKNGDVNYSREGRGANQGNLSFNTAFQNGFDDLRSLGVSLDDVRYQQYDDAKHELTYQSYINGYPIIADNLDGTYRIIMQKNGTVSYQFSANTLQVPLPNNNKTVNLPSTNEVLQTLKNNNYNLGKIHDIVVGYQWTENSSSQEVIDLTPTYFIHYNGNWVNYQDLSQNH